MKKIQVVNKNIHKIKQEILMDYTGEFEMVGNLKLGDQIRQTHVRFRNVADYETYINAVDEGYDAEDAIFNGYNYKVKISQFNLVNRSEYRKGCGFKHEITEYHGNKCFISKGYCFVNCINFLTRQEYKEQYLEFF